MSGGEVTTLSFKVAGLIETVAIVDNQSVKAGDLLLKLDDRDYRAQLARTEANIAARRVAVVNVGATRRMRVSMLDQARADLAAAMAERVRAEYDIDRYRTLSNNRFTPRQRFEQAEADHEKARAGERTAQAALEAAERQLEISGLHGNPLTDRRGRRQSQCARDTNQPLMMGSIEWQVPAGTADLRFDDYGVGETSSASPTTLMNWTRTGRNFELWNASKDGSLDQYKLSDVIARWNKDKTACSFYEARDARNGRPLNFEPPRSRDCSPLYVHRHHAVIATRNAKGIGRPVEAYAGGSSPPGLRRIFVSLAWRYASCAPRRIRNAGSSASVVLFRWHRQGPRGVQDGSLRSSLDLGQGMG